MSQLLLNPSLQSYYFSAIDALPLASNMTIGRTVSLEGDTLELHLSLPLYDAEGARSPCAMTARAARAICPMTTPFPWKAACAQFR